MDLLALRPSFPEWISITRELRLLRLVGLAIPPTNDGVDGSRLRACKKNRRQRKRATTASVVRPVHTHEL